MTFQAGSRRIPSYRRHKATGQAIVTLDGKDLYLGRYGSPASRDKYARLIAEWVALGRQAPALLPASRGGLTVNEVILAYWQHVLEYYQDAPVEREKIKLALRPLRQLYGRSEAAAFGPLSLKAVRGEMCKTLARRTVNQRVDIIRRMFKWAVSNEMLPASVYEALRTVEGLKKGRSNARETEPVHPVSDAVVDETLPWVNRHVRAMIEFERLTGARPGEVCRLRPADIDRSGPVWVYRPRRHKNYHRDHERLIYIGPRAQEVLQPFLNISTEDYIFSPRRMMLERYKEMRCRRKTKANPDR